jgi:GNAT superfamily N-acetyltransferase
VSPGVELPAFDERDADAVAALDAWAMRVAGTDPADVPGHDVGPGIGDTYSTRGGEFLVGVHHEGDERPLKGAAVDDCGSSGGGATGELETFDGWVVAMGGYLPSEAGYEDERTVENAAELHRMRVAPPLQGEGYGRQLLAALERRAERAGFERLLATTASRQERALGLYAAAGYERVGGSEYDGYELVHFEKTVERSS